MATWGGRDPEGVSLCEGHRSLDLAGLLCRRAASRPVIQATVMSSGHWPPRLAAVQFSCVESLRPLLPALVRSCQREWDQFLQEVGHGQARRAWTLARADANLAVAGAPLPGSMGSVGLQVCMGGAPQRSEPRGRGKAAGVRSPGGGSGALPGKGNTWAQSQELIVDAPPLSPQSCSHPSTAW